MPPSRTQAGRAGIWGARPAALLEAMADPSPASEPGWRPYTEGSHVLNVVVLIGRLARDPELRYTSAGIGVARFTLAVDRPFTDSQGQKATDFIGVVCWRQLAETVSQHLRKGRIVAVQGSLHIRKYQTPEGAQRKVAEVSADQVRFLDRPPQPGAAADAADDGEDADAVPF